MTKREGREQTTGQHMRDALGDRELTRLFASMDGVVASDELKESTLAAIFGQMDEEERSRQNDATLLLDTVERTAIRPRPALVADSVESQKPTASHGRLRSTQSMPVAAQRTRKKRRGAQWKMRVAAVLVIVAIGVGGGIAYALPVNHVLMSVDDTTFDLGVNVFGTTVSATANNDAGKNTLAATEVRNMGYRDAMNRLLDKFEQDYKNDVRNISVLVNDRFGNRQEELSKEANGVLEGREARGARSSASTGAVAGKETPPQDEYVSYGGASPSDGGEQTWGQPQWQQQEESQWQPQQPQQPQQQEQPQQQQQQPQQSQQQPQQQGQQRQQQQEQSQEQQQPQQQRQEQQQQPQEQQAQQQQPQEQQQGQPQEQQEQEQLQPGESQEVQQPQESQEEGQQQQQQPQAEEEVQSQESQGQGLQSEQDVNPAQSF